MDPIQVLGYFGAFLVGLILGLIGSGGSILSLPILVYIFGVNPVLATGYSLFIVGTTSLIGSIKNLKDNLINYDTTLFFSISSQLFSIGISHIFWIGSMDRVSLGGHSCINTHEERVRNNIILQYFILISHYFQINIFWGI